MDPDVPLVVPEVNPRRSPATRRSGIIANPNCSTIQMVVALKPMHDAAGIKRVVVSTYQSVSGAGKEAMDELWNQTKRVFVNRADAGRSSPSRSPSTSFPQIDVFMDDGSPRKNGR
jgi:aspartate-semialdehyde dehydrogenase